VQQLQQNMVFSAKTTHGCGSMQNMPQHMVLCAISSRNMDTSTADARTSTSGFKKKLMRSHRLQRNKLN
jgi:hypothetical protein